MDNSIQIAKVDRWSAKNTPIDRNLAISNTSYRLSNLIINEFYLRNNKQNRNLWVSTVYGVNLEFGPYLHQLNKASGNIFFFNNLSNLALSREFFQKRTNFFALNQSLKKSFFTKLIKSTTLKPTLNTTKSGVFSNNVTLFEYLTEYNLHFITGLFDIEFYSMEGNNFNQELTPVFTKVHPIINLILLDQYRELDYLTITSKFDYYKSTSNSYVLI
jgi:hypothetical protein